MQIPGLSFVLWENGPAVVKGDNVESHYSSHYFHVSLFWSLVSLFWLFSPHLSLYCHFCLSIIIPIFISVNYAKKKTVFRIFPQVLLISGTGFKLKPPPPAPQKKEKGKLFSDSQRCFGVQIPATSCCCLSPRFREIPFPTFTRPSSALPSPPPPPRPHFLLSLFFPPHSLFCPSSPCIDPPDTVTVSQLQATTGRQRRRRRRRRRR